MSDVRHAVNKHPSWCSPTQRLIHDSGMDGDTEPGPLVRGSPST
ncbi:hypothetical protein I552_0459 [Mycobacterium xenopi 3993]|nr:hypothetical protein I552_0459 [Mycobacterium xenopi 3993]